MTISDNNPGPVMKILFTQRPHIMQQAERIFQLGPQSLDLLACSTEEINGPFLASTRSGVDKVKPKVWFKYSL